MKICTKDSERMRLRRSRMTPAELVAQRKKDRDRARLRRAGALPCSPPKGYVRISTAAKQLGVPWATIRRYVDQGMPHKIGLFTGGRQNDAESGQRMFRLAVNPDQIISWRDAEREHKESLRRTKWARSRHKRRAAKLATPIEDLNDVDEAILHIRSKQRLKCYWCGRVTSRENRHIDHIIPLSRGGAHAAHNLACSCPVCNTSKRAKMPEEFTGQYELPLWSSGESSVFVTSNMVNSHWVQKLVGVGESTVREWRRRGLPSTKVGRLYFYDPEKVRQWVARRGLGSF